ncbi:Voltage-gated potassium channel [Venustampulla echinocandica]|uniref:Calcium-channel protein CCH1 n=1 Tax=Venustampulla echinocandica TaxID=2656787 RepID=A0A370U2E0_9HELO|nr:Voltage-gated potassium channel [Venustampulla echinocandica]RDL41950.1 Voltage-gated potassium channel [Venustampulla echinocandica]
MPPPGPQDSANPYPSTPLQSIPLQNLGRGQDPPPESVDVAHSRGRTLLSGGSRPLSGYNNGPRYERLDETSPSPVDRTPRRAGATPTPLSIIPQSRPPNDPETPISPVGNPADFQAAMGFAGLLVPDISVSQAPRTNSPYGSGDFSGASPYGDSREDLSGYDPGYFPPDSDSIPLTDTNHLQPVSGAEAYADRGQGHDRSGSFHSVDFASSGAGRHASYRLGDELGLAENGLSRGSLSPDSRNRSRSPSTTSGALSRAGSMVRAMSQRVVNLSGEAELIEMSARREAARQSSIPPVPSLPSEPQPFFRSQYDEPLPTDPKHQSGVSPAPAEKAMRFFGSNSPEPSPNDERKLNSNPLKGNSLGIFSPESRIRNRLCDMLVWPITEPVILILIMVQTVLLAVDSSKNVFTNPRPERWGGSAIDLAILALFIIFTLEIIVRVIVSGFVINAPEYSTIDRNGGVKAMVLDKYRTFFTPKRGLSVKGHRASPLVTAPTVLRSFTVMQGEDIRTVEQAQRLQLARRAFLRHGFNRLDFVAVVAFWISFVLGVAGMESRHHIYLFKMLSCLRILRLLALTHGTAIILRSLKKAAPLLVNVGFLIGFFWLLFAIIGVQSFKSSFDRQCVWIDPLDHSNKTGSAYTHEFQFCGGQFNNDTGAHDPWKLGPLDGTQDVDRLENGTTSIKGYLCPRGSYCIQLEGDQLPYSGTVSFDNIFQSLELVFVTMTANTYTDIMYYTTNSDYLAAAIFFAGGIMIMMLWLLNLLIAVITSSFQVIREEGKASAFAAHVKTLLPTKDPGLPRRVSSLKRLFDKTQWVWVICIAYDLVAQSIRSTTMSASRGRLIDTSETVVTFILLVEIVLRFAVDWRGFARDKKNWFDLGLAVITTIILIPPIRNSGQPYAWLTVFQLLRVYRVIIAVPVTRKLLTLVLGNSSGIGNLMLFVFLITFLISIFAVQLFRGEIDQFDDGGDPHQVTFATIYNAFLGMYQILSSENWTEVLYNVTMYGNSRHSGWIGAIFFIGWFILANFILVNMFIAVIQENFDVSEDEKRMHQLKAFLNRKELGGSSSNLSLSAVFRFGRARAPKDPLDYGPATMEMLLKDAVVKDFLDDEIRAADESSPHINTPPAQAPVANNGLLSSLRDKFVSRVWNREPNPFYSNIQFSSRPDEPTDARTLAKEAVSATSQRKKAQREFLARHPTYNNALFILKPTNPVRRFCQRIVGPGRGNERIDGVEPNKVVWYTFSAFIYAAIVAMVLLACVTTPLYQKEYFDTHTFNVKNWFVWADMSFAILFTAEALIKVVADGFFWTPNAYFRSSWGLIDGIVLITFWISVSTSLLNDGAVSRAVGAFKALRALRLLNVSDSARETFHSLIIVGGAKFFSAAFVSLSLLIPFAIYGLNLFHGQMVSCNDGSDSISGLADCFGEWGSTPYSNDWILMTPRVASNSYYNFDDFASSLFILFQIVSQEGWVDVMWSAESITGRGLQPKPFASQGNALFFVIFNLLATVFVLTLFISVFMRNYTEQTGVAFLTADQRSWLELRKLLKQVSPSKRPSNNLDKNWKDWCYKRAVRKHGKWQRAITGVLVLHLILLLLEYNNEPEWWDLARTYIFLGFTIFYIANVVVRIVGLSWARFRRSSWDIYSIISISGTLVTTILFLANPDSQLYIRLHKTFLVSIVLLLIPRNDALDQLFKTAAASLTNIGNLLATWFIFFLVFAIAMTQTFGLTRFGSAEDGNINFRTVPKALILLFRMSTGEGWNGVMEDYAGIEPPLCISGLDFFESDCGSQNWARGLFIAWNILSMYIFTSLFVSLIYESFSYVYQHSSGLGKVSREELRRFKQAWATLDPEGTGYISKEAFPRLLGELSGVFEMRIYSQENSVRRILEDIQSEQPSGRISAMATSSASSGVDLKALNKRLNTINPEQVRLARTRYNLFFEEVMVSADADRGISFTTVLLILAHYNVISDNKSLKLEEFLRRRARLQRVEEEIRRRIVLGFFDTMYWSRTFRRHMERKRSGRMTDIPQLGPEVFIDDEEEVVPKPGKSPASERLSPMDIVDTRSSFIAHGLDGARRHRSGESQSPSSFGGPLSPAFPSPNTGKSPQLSPHRPTNSAFSFEGGELGEAASAASSRRGSGVSAENVLQILDNSAWGESIRRSFTMKRPPNRRDPPS